MFISRYSTKEDDKAIHIQYGQSIIIENIRHKQRIIFSEINFNRSNRQVSKYKIQIFNKSLRNRFHDTPLLPPLVLVLDKVIKDTWPRVLIRVRVNITSLRKVQEHVPRVLRDAPDLLRILPQVSQPLAQHLWRVHRKHQSPQTDRHVQRQCSQFRFQSKSKG